MIIRVLSTSLVLASGCGKSCDDESNCSLRRLGGLNLRFVPAQGVLSDGVWDFRLDIVEPEEAAAAVRCDVTSAVATCNVASAVPDYEIDLADFSANTPEMWVIRSTPEPLAQPGVDGGVSGPSALDVVVLRDGSEIVRKTRIRPDYVQHEIKRGRVLCEVCLEATEELAL